MLERLRSQPRRPRAGPAGETRRGRAAGGRMALSLMSGLALLGGALAGLAGAQTRAYIDERTGVAGWAREADGVSIRLIQRLPDQTRAFFLGRGFGRPAVERLAGHCVMQTVVRNTDEARPLRLDLAEWRAETTDGTRRLMLERAWQREWARRGEAESARLAFRWSLFPTEQRFEPGDWNMGMTTYPFPPGTRFDLHAVWHRGETLRRATLEDVVCAPDVSVEEYRRPE